MFSDSFLGGFICCKLNRVTQQTTLGRFISASLNFSEFQKSKFSVYFILVNSYKYVSQNIWLLQTPNHEKKLGLLLSEKKQKLSLNI